MEQEQKDVIQDIYNTLEYVSKDERTEYKHRFKEGNNEWTETLDREEHLQAIIEWALQQIENNFDFEEENINELGN
ncbi:type II toxin-antitoxin system antitoxin TscA [Staphylococcus epidermidis]|uniref:type II toxin-antitoxin system antitoxin TscA n=1 Tax=Staphylococcus epidermidis TaxID=1282 RepID=UPI0022DEEFA8|nr:hypothetical protein [Staphylococcus epidermidis]MCG2001309.1 hypothetical protein [Staphylococcus epidermidis]MCG2005878.1 hypothetical protein [Staphylococcus epidermidis]MCG2044294.1 hypothetical protein [Staphylococcus epidermidis]